VETLYDEGVKFFFFTLNELSEIKQLPAYNKISIKINRNEIAEGKIPKLVLVDKSGLNNDKKDDDGDEDNENEEDEDNEEKEKKGSNMDIDENSQFVQKLDKIEELLQNQFENISYENDGESDNKKEKEFELEKIKKLVKDAESLMDNNIVTTYIELINKIYTDNQNLYSYIDSMEDKCSRLEETEGFDEYNIKIEDSLTTLEVYRNLRYLFHLPETFSIYYTSELINLIGNKPTLVLFYRCYIITISGLFFSSKEEFKPEESLGEWSNLENLINLEPIINLFKSIKSNQKLVVENYNTFAFTYFKLLLYILDKITTDSTFKTLYAFFAGGVVYLKQKVISMVGEEVQFNIYMINGYVNAFKDVWDSMNNLMKEGFEKNSKLNN